MDTTEHIWRSLVLLTPTSLRKRLSAHEQENVMIPGDESYGDLVTLYRLARERAEKQTNAG
jgi:hypothetical protein